MRRADRPGVRHPGLDQSSRSGCRERHCHQREWAGGLAGDSGEHAQEGPGCQQPQRHQEPRDNRVSGLGPQQLGQAAATPIAAAADAMQSKDVATRADLSRRSRTAVYPAHIRARTAAVQYRPVIAC